MEWGQTPFEFGDTHGMCHRNSVFISVQLAFDFYLISSVFICGYDAFSFRVTRSSFRVPIFTHSLLILVQLTESEIKCYKSCCVERRR